MYRSSRSSYDISMRVDEINGRVKRVHNVTFPLRYFLLLTVTFQSQTFSQNRNFRFTRIGVEHGLPTSTVYSVFQDSKGFMWFGTTGGLCRYDGYTFKIYDETPVYAGSMFLEDKRGSLWFFPGGGEVHRLDLLSNNVTRYSIGLGHRAYVISEDDLGDIWVGTMGDGLGRYSPSADSFLVYKNDSAIAGSVSSDTIYAIHQDSQGNLWIGTGRGLEKFQRALEKFVHCEPVGTDPVRAIAEDKDGSIWLATSDGLCRLDIATGIFVRYRNGDPTLNRIYSLYITPKGKILVAVGDGRVEQFDKPSGKFKSVKRLSGKPARVAATMVDCFLEDREERFWMLTSRGLGLLDQRDGIIHMLEPDENDPHTMPEGNATCMIEDLAGNLWFGTQTGGICFLDHVANDFQYVSSKPSDRISLSHASVSAIIEDKSGVVWVGSLHGLDRLDLSAGTKTHYDENAAGAAGLKNGRVLKLLQDSSGLIWIGTSGGLCMLDPATGRFSYYQQHAERVGLSAAQEIVSICIDRNGAMWLGGGIGSGLLMRFDRESRKFDDYYFCGLPGYSGQHSHPAANLLEDRNGVLWLTAGALEAFDRNTGRARYYRHEPEDSTTLSSGNPASICEDRTGKLWFGLSTGLDCYESKTDKFRHIKFTDGLMRPMIYELLEDNCVLGDGTRRVGMFWMATVRGISRFNPVTGVTVDYGPAEGVPIAPSEFMHSSYKSRDGHLYFGGANGFVRFNPDSVKDNSFIPPIVITSFHLFNVEARLDSDVSIKRQIDLSFEQDVLTFEFAALNYSHPEENRYSYRMEGFDRDWVSCGTRHSAMYTSLPPGSYVFRVKGTNNNGIWNTKGASVALVIRPPWWRTDAAYLGYALILIGACWLGWQIQLRRIKIRHAFEMTRFEAEKLHEIDELKSRFFANISHEFRTPLTLILGPVKEIAGRIADRQMREELLMVHRNTTRLLNLVNQLLDIAKLESGNMRLRAAQTNIVQVLKAWTLSFSSQADRKRITLVFNPQTESLIAYVDMEKLEKIVMNILSNAFKFTPEDGRVEVGVKNSGGWAEISVCDTGIGIPKEKLSKVFDRFYQVNGGRTREGEGTGIGLSITKELVELHKGKVSVESVEGRGTTFKVSIPLGKDHLTSEEVCDLSPGSDERPMAVWEQVPIADRRPKNHELGVAGDANKTAVLVVEDNPDVRRYIKVNLDGECEVMEAVNGEDGLNKSREHLPDIVISDVMMPKMDGFQLCRFLKTDERTSHIPVILLTAKATTRDKIDGFETGADEYIMKPFDPEELKSRINNLIEQRKRLHDHFRRKGIVELTGLKVTSVDEKFLRKISGLIEDNISNASFGVESLAEMSAVSRSVLHRKVLSLTGDPPVELIRKVRLKRAAELIDRKAGNMSEIALEVGFTNPAYFSECFKKQFGVSPSQYKRS